MQFSSQSSRPSMLKSIGVSFIFVTSLSTLFLGCGGESSSVPQARLMAGDLISNESLVPAKVYTNAASAQKIRYRMKSVAGDLTEANAVLMLPKGTAPLGGWPLIVWAHGTTGVADACAPSRSAFAEDSYTISPMLDAGYAVLAPDYEGLDAAGTHPYLIADSEAYSVLHAVLAAQKIKDVSLSKKWAVLGHSQGGHAALATAQYAPEIAAQYPLVATVAFAPGSDVATITDLNFAAIAQLEAAGDIDSAAYAMAAMNFYGTFLMYGAQTYAPKLNIATVFGDEMKNVIPLAPTDKTCSEFGNALNQSLLKHLASGNSVASFKGVRKDWYTDPVVKALLYRAEVGKVKLTSPVFLAHGSTDLDVPMGASQKLVEGMKAIGTNVNAVFIPGLDHTQVVIDQMPAALQFVKAKWNQ